MTFSIILAKIGSKLIGRYFFTRILCSFLCTGTAFATFQISGYFPFLRDYSKISFKGI